jgi:hypothetical protein
MQACSHGVSRYAKDVTENDELITIGHKSLPVIAVSRAFGKTVITYGDTNAPKQKTFKDTDNVVIDERVYKQRIKNNK